MLSEFQREKKEGQTKKYNQGIMSKTLEMFEGYQPMDWRSRANHKLGASQKLNTKNIITKLLKTKDRGKKNTWKQKDTTAYIKRKTIWMTTDLSSEIIEARRKWHSIFQMLKENNW